MTTLPPPSPPPMTLPAAKQLANELRVSFGEWALESLQSGKLKPLGQALVRYAGATMAIACFYGILGAFGARALWHYFRGKESKKQDALLNQQIQGTFRQVSQMSRQLADMQATLNTLKRNPTGQAMPSVARNQNFPVTQSYYAPSYTYPQYMMGHPYG